jgi:hypothetical protein
MGLAECCGLEKKIPVPGHEVNIPRAGGLAENVKAFTLKCTCCALRHIVTCPYLKEVSQNEDSLGWCAQDVVGPGLKSGSLTGLQVKVRDEVDTTLTGDYDLLESVAHGRV